MNAVTVIGDIGSLDATPGSKRWALAIRAKIQHFIDQAESDAEHLETYLQLVRKHEGWKQLANRNGKRFASYESFCICKRPHGLGYRSEDIDRIVAERKAANAQQLVSDPDIVVQQNGRPKKGIQCLPLPKGGNTVARIVARLKRDAPEIAEALAKGEYKSARAAAIAAGIQKVPTPYEVAVKAIKKLEKRDVAKLIRWLRNEYRK